MNGIENNNGIFNTRTVNPHNANKRRDIVVNGFHATSAYEASAIMWPNLTVNKPTFSS